MLFFLYFLTAQTFVLLGLLFSFAGDRIKKTITRHFY